MEQSSTTTFFKSDIDIYWCSKCNTSFRFDSPRRVTIYDIICTGDGYHKFTYSTPSVYKLQGRNIDTIVMDEYNDIESEPKNKSNRKNQPAYTKFLKHYGKNK